MDVSMHRRVATGAAAITASAQQAVKVLALHPPVFPGVSTPLNCTVALPTRDTETREGEESVMSWIKRRC